MNHNKTTLAIASIVVAVALAGIAFAIPQQVLAGGHHNHKHNNNSVKVDQQINQQNSCTTPSSPPSSPPPPAADNSNGTSTSQPLERSDSVDTTGSSSSTVCLNSGDNSADIHK